MEQRTPQWHEQRKSRITGSRCGAILGLSPWQKPADVLRAMVREYHGAETEFTGNPATDHGNNNEQRALLAFMRESGLDVEQCGFFAYGELMGASPDGLTDDGGVLELKVPFGLRNEQAAQFKPLADQPHYFAQVQMEILAAGRSHAYFAQYVAPKGDPLSHDYVPEQMKIERVEVDPEWLDKHLPAISAFYALYVEELNNPEHLEPLRVVIDTPESGTIITEIDELRARQKADDEREKELLKELAVLCGGKNALIHGRKMTMVERKGNVDYGKVPQLKGVDLEKYRKKSSSFWKFG